MKKIIIHFTDNVSGSNFGAKSTCSNAKARKINPRFGNRHFHHFWSFFQKIYQPKILIGGDINNYNHDVYVFFWCWIRYGQSKFEKIIFSDLKPKKTGFGGTRFF